MEQNDFLSASSLGVSDQENSVELLTAETAQWSESSSIVSPTPEIDVELNGFERLDQQVEQGEAFHLKVISESPQVDVKVDTIRRTELDPLYEALAFEFVVYSTVLFATGAALGYFQLLPRLLAVAGG